MTAFFESRLRDRTVLLGMLSLMRCVMYVGTGNGNRKSGPFINTVMALKARMFVVKLLTN